MYSEAVTNTPNHQFTFGKTILVAMNARAREIRP
jgi:hypothetical protein